MKVRFLMIAFVLLFACGKKEEKLTEKEKTQETQTIQVVFQKVQDFVEATGSVQPDKEGVVKITSRLPGVVQSINVQVGDKVKKGQLLAVIKAPDTTDLYSQKISLTAQLEQSKRLYELKQRLYEVGAIPKSELMDAETNYKVIKAQLEGVEQRLRLLGGGMGVSNVRSPIDGVVYQISAHVGDSVDTSTEIMSVADPKRVMVVALLPEKDAFKVKRGNTVEFSISTYPDRNFKGIVKYVSDVVDPETHAVKVYIEPSEKEPFKINMFFNIKILTGEKEYAVLPKRVLLYQDGKFYVYLLENGKIEKKEVVFVKELEDGNVVLEGLQEGQKVLLSPMREVSP